MKKIIHIFIAFSIFSLLFAEELYEEDKLNPETAVIIADIQQDLKNIDIKKYDSFDIKVMVVERKMYFYGLNNGQNELLHTYVIGSPKIGVNYPKTPCKLLKVELNPWWHPTKKTIDEFRIKKNIILENAIPPGHKLNYMGNFKIIISDPSGKRWSIYRIHGNIDKESIGKRSSGGCVRMYNDEGKEFAIFVRDILKQGKQISILYI